ncbi:MFS transporter [Streptomyces sp. NPDC032161]|uniref:MFS transporter n=1 Tax=unclassified Streptomyces TaxID=2593676 RepID=UPI003404BB8A
MSADGRREGAITFRRPAVFWAGTALGTTGAALHLPMFFEARSMGYHMAHMRPDAAMTAGMAAVMAGCALAFWGLLPPQRRDERPVDLRVRALDDAPLRRSHAGLVLVLTLVVTIDVMKPTTLSFVAPGVAAEYGLSSPLRPDGGLPVSLLPLSGLLGTVLGSVVWGVLADRVGRRPAILFAGVLFTTTSVCGAMPTFTANLVMCFLMGIGAGGMLPVAFALLAETVPARHRGWLLVLIGGNAALAYALTSQLAESLVPHYGWRVLWLIGMPTGLLVLLLNRWIPESPRYLVLAGRAHEARAVMERYGSGPVPSPRSVTTPAATTARSEAPVRGGPLLLTGLLLLALSVGIVTYGFQLWIPTDLQRMGIEGLDADRILRNAALFGLPINVVAAFAYGFWSSKWTTVLLGGLTVAPLFCFMALGDGVAEHRTLLMALLAAPVVSVYSLGAITIAYCAEIYPTALRGRATGRVAGLTKFGGVAMLILTLLSLATPELRVTAATGAVPLACAVVVLAVAGVETRRRAIDTPLEAEPQPARAV